MSSYRPRKKIYRLIYEGNNKTERTFFQHLFHRSSYMPIDQLPTSPETDPKSLFLFGQKEISRLHLSRSLGDRVFIVMDLDQRNDHKEYVRSHAKTNKLIVFVPSQPCIEAFFLLHFVMLKDLSASGDQIIAALKEYIQNYDKSLDVYPQLEGKNGLASSRLRTLSKPERIRGTILVPDLLDLLKK
ncbi:MAG: hypothetical protein BWY98_00960 [Tenericutes bacterium ADurb.BinA155]|nr:MAG: hypothetical protein BWY98_00960 [Tenericutes bacterium ADurb.BinA155]